MCDLLWSDPDDRLSKFFNYLLFVGCCGSRVFITDPDSFPIRIPDPTTTKKRRGKTSCFFEAINFTNLISNFFLRRSGKFLSEF